MTWVDLPEPIGPLRLPCDITLKYVPVDEPNEHGVRAEAHLSCERHGHLTGWDDGFPVPALEIREGIVRHLREYGTVEQISLWDGR